MTAQGQHVARPWQDARFARKWAQNDAMADLLRLPRSIAAALVGYDRPRISLTVDIGSGPGAFLETFMEEFPQSRGVWFDASQAMREQAEDHLARFGDRVDFLVGDMTALRESGLPDGADVVTTSRATHHLDGDALRAFYAEAAGLLAPGGWLVNLDHFAPSEIWDQRMRAIRPRFQRPTREQHGHHHDHPLPDLQAHLDAFAAAGVDDVEVVWRAFYTCLLAGRRHD